MGLYELAKVLVVLMNSFGAWLMVVVHPIRISMYSSSDWSRLSFGLFFFFHSFSQLIQIGDWTRNLFKLNNYFTSLRLILNMQISSKQHITQLKFSSNIHRILLFAFVSFKISFQNFICEFYTAKFQSVLLFEIDYSHKT